MGEGTPTRNVKAGSYNVLIAHSLRPCLDGTLHCLKLQVRLSALVTRHDEAKADGPPYSHRAFGKLVVHALQVCEKCMVWHVKIRPLSNEQSVRPDSQAPCVPTCAMSTEGLCTC